MGQTLFAFYSHSCVHFDTPIYRKSAPNMLAWTRFTVNQLKHACMDSIYRKSASNTLAWLRFTVNQLKHACMDSIYRKSASSRLAWTRFTVNQLQAGLHGPIYSISAPSRLAWLDIQYIKRHDLPPKKKSPEPWTYHPCPGDFFMRSTVGSAYRRPPPLPPWRGGRLPRAAGSV